MRRKLGNGPGVGKCPFPGQCKICKCPIPGTDKAGKYPAVARGGRGGRGGGRWARVELTDALRVRSSHFYCATVPSVEHKWKINYV